MVHCYSPVDDNFPIDELLGELQTTVSPSVLSVICYSKSTYAASHREVAPWNDKKIEEIVEELRLQSLENDYLATLYDSDQLLCTLDICDEKFLVHLAIDDGKGILVAVEPDFFNLQEFVTDLIRVYDSFVEENLPQPTWDTAH